MKKAGKIIIIVIAISLVISVGSAILLTKNSNVFDEFNNEVSEQFSNMAENLTDPTDDKKVTEHTETTDETEATIEETTEEKESIDEKSELEKLIGEPLEKFMEKVEELEYEAVYLAEGVDFTEFIGDVYDLYLTGELEIDVENKSVTVSIVSESKLESAKQEGELKEKLPLYQSWVAVEDYGKLAYGDFKLNYIAGRIAEELEDENTWFLKATCKVYGVKMTCEATVTGTGEHPQVVSFIVY